MTEAEDIKPGQKLLNAIRAAGLDAYGSDIPAEWVREVLALKMPAIGTKRDFDSVTFAEMVATDYVRNVLLGEGKYFGMKNGGYRVLLPSENAAQVESYMQQADRKLKRGLKLSRSTPSNINKMPSNLDARLLMKRDSIRHHLKKPPAAIDDAYKHLAEAHKEVSTT